jgi:hypothetical protein
VIPAKAGTHFPPTDGGRMDSGLRRDHGFGKSWEQIMRAETQAVVDDIQKSLALLRRHL